MKRVQTKKKRPATHKPAKTPFEIVTMTNYYNLAVMVRTLFMVNGWNYEQIKEFIESYVVLLDEVSGKRSTVWDFIADTQKMTGIDVVKELEDVCTSFRV